MLDSYPHQLSGGMKQRTVIALSLLLDPKILILDEPTTALDVITQAYIMDMLRDIRTDLGITMIFLTHDVSIMGKAADRMAVIPGQIVELGSVFDIFYNPLPIHRRSDGSRPSLIDDVSKRRSIPGSPRSRKSTLVAGLPRCSLPEAELCSEVKSGKLVEVKPGHLTTCHEWKRLDA